MLNNLGFNKGIKQLPQAKINTDGTKTNEDNLKVGGKIGGDDKLCGKAWGEIWTKENFEIFSQGMCVGDTFTVDGKTYVVNRIEYRDGKKHTCFVKQ